MSTRDRLKEEAAKQFAERGYLGTSIGDLAQSLGIQKSSVYSHIENKEDLLVDLAVAGACHFHQALDELPDDATPVERIRLALLAHLRVVHAQLDVATVWLKEWRFLEGEARRQFLKERRRYERRIRQIFKEAVDDGSLRKDLDLAHAVLLFFSVGNWAYTWMSEGTKVEAEADKFWTLLSNGFAAD